MKNVREMKMMNVRVPVEIKRWLQDRAEANRRSLNAEVVVIMEQTKSMEDVRDVATDSA